MGLLKTLSNLLGGYPGGWRKYARGLGPQDATPPFVEPAAPEDRRSLIPPLGLREYWYPALPAKDVGWKKPVGLKLLGTELVLFRDKSGEVKALWDYCPHRGVFLSWGNCFWKGYLSCPYHGATYNGDGECVEFLTEGPDSKMVGRLKARVYPTRTLKGVVFVWMGEGEPVPIEEDLPPEFFEGEQGVVRSTFRYWDCNWMIALENTNDAHNMFYVHRNSIRFLRSRFGGRPRTPQGYASKVVNNKTVVVDRSSQQYYAVEGKIPYQLYYPRVGGYWPKYRWRLLWTWIFELFDRLNAGRPAFESPEEWQGFRLPGMQRVGWVWGPGAMYTRWVIPVDKDLTRVYYFRSSRVRTRMGRLIDRLAYALYRDWMVHYNFSDQDYDAMRSVRYQYPEFLSSTDGYMVATRRLIAEHARGLRRTPKDGKRAEAPAPNGELAPAKRRSG